MDGKPTYEKAAEVLEVIPQECRQYIAVTAINLFQENEKSSVYSIYKRAIELGYQYPLRNNVYMSCEVCLKNGAVLDVTGNLVVCTNVPEEDRVLGRIDEQGEIRLKNPAKYYQLKTISALDNPECRECIELPFCTGTCKYAKYQENSKCLGKRGDGLSMEEKAKLDYYYDQRG